jgi:hypothetical protein
LVTRVRSRTAEKVDSIGLLVFRQPMLSWEVEEGEQFFGVVGDLGHRLGPLGPVVAREHLDRTNSVVPVGGVADLGQGPAGAGLHAGGQTAEHVGGLVDPVALVAGSWEDVAERRPQPQRAVPDRDHRRLHPAPPQIPQDLRPAVGRLPLAVGHRDQLLKEVRPSGGMITVHHRDRPQ